MTTGGVVDVRTSHTSTDVTAANSNTTLRLLNGSGDGVYNAIKFSGNQQDMYIMSFNDNTQADRRIGFFAGSVAGDATTDERLSIRGDGSVGVGISSPQAKLHSYTSGTGSIPTGQFNQTADDNTALALINANNSATYSAIKLETRETQAAGWMIANEWQSAFNGDLVFRGRDGGTTSAEVLRLKSNGSATCR